MESIDNNALLSKFVLLITFNTSRMKKTVFIIVLFISYLTKSYSQPPITAYTNEVLLGNNGGVLFKIHPDGHYEWYKEALGGIKVNSVDTSFYNALPTEYIVGPTADCAAGDVCLFAIDLASRQGTMRALSTSSAVSSICSGSLNLYKIPYLLIETLTDSVSLDTLEVLQPSSSILSTHSYNVTINANDPIGQYCLTCSGGVFADWPDAVLYEVPTVTKVNILNQMQLIKIPVSYLFEKAGRYWVVMPDPTQTGNYHYLDCQLPLAAGRNLWVTPQFDNATVPLAKAITTENDYAQTGLYGAFFNMDFSLRKNCLQANGCSRIKVSGPNPTIVAGTTKEVVNGMAFLFPNPAQTKLQINLPNERISKVDILNQEGKIIFTKSNTNELDLQTISAGMYVVKIYTDKESFIEKLFVE